MISVLFAGFCFTSSKIMVWKQWFGFYFIILLTLGSDPLQALSASLLLKTGMIEGGINKPWINGLLFTPGSQFYFNENGGVTEVMTAA